MTLVLLSPRRIFVDVTNTSIHFSNTTRANSWEAQKV